jgi:3-oxoacyl-[acyl-carrier protein] reductase
MREIGGTRAIVTGAGSGIGAAVVRALLEGGAACVGLVVRNAEKLDRAILMLREAGWESRVFPMLADVRDPQALGQTFASFIERCGGLDVLVNNAGILKDGTLVSFSMRGIARYPLETWHETIDCNLTGAFLCSQLAAEHMFRKRCKGVIVNISSISRKGRAGQAAYSASKGGVASLTATLAQELSPYNIRCVAVAPGLVETPMAQTIPQEHRDEMCRHVAVKRMGRPEEIAHGVLFCIQNEYFNGRILELDGGAFG